MQVATQHAERQCVPRGVGVVEGFFLDRVDLHPGHVPRRSAQLPVGVESNAAHAVAPRQDAAAMTAGQTPNPPAALAYHQLGCGGHGVAVQKFLESNRRGHAVHSPNPPWHSIRGFAPRNQTVAWEARRRRGNRSTPRSALYAGEPRTASGMNEGCLCPIRVYGRRCPPLWRARGRMRLGLRPLRRNGIIRMAVSQGQQLGSVETGVTRSERAGVEIAFPEPRALARAIHHGRGCTFVCARNFGSRS